MNQVEHRLDQVRSQWYQVQGEILIKDQLLQEVRHLEKQNAEMYEEQISELKDALDRKEYLVQYKENIWAAFEKELKKAVKKDSELYKEIN